jgi:hypothetical protein
MPGVNLEVRGADTCRVQQPGTSGQHPDMGTPRPLALGGLRGVTPAAATPMVYVDTDIPAGMTLAEWRRARRDHAAPRRSARWTVLRLARRLAS